MLAVSGGIDSMVLLDLMYRSRLNFSVAHCNFRLRSEDSDADEELVRRVCQEKNIPFFVKKCPVSKSVNVQLEARKLRYTWFEELRRKHGFDYILTAHHTDDNIETFFINLFRGSGLKGLTGIGETKVIKRPLLGFSRKQIENYAEKHRIPWREDVSNASDRYLRNAIRLKLIPVIEQIKPGALQAIHETVKLLQASWHVEQEWFGQLKKRLIHRTNDTEWIFLKDLPDKPAGPLFLYKWLAPYGFTDFVAVNRLPDAQTGKFVTAPNHLLIKEHDKLTLRKNNPSPPGILIFEQIPETIPGPVKLKFQFLDAEAITPEALRKTNEKTACIDAGLLKPPFALRPWKPGERMKPLGMKGTKKISDILTGLKVPRHEKQNVLVFTSQDVPVWLVGYKIDDRFKITQNTKTILKISIL